MFASIFFFEKRKYFTCYGGYVGYISNNLIFLFYHFCILIALLIFAVLQTNNIVCYLSIKIIRTYLWLIYITNTKVTFSYFSK